MRKKDDNIKSAAEGCLTAVLTIVLVFFGMMLQAAAWGTFIFLVYKVLVFFGLFA